MVKKKKGKWSTNAADRWCVDCGLNPRPGTNRYNAGDVIIILGELNVLCLRCREYKEGTSRDGTPLRVCKVCYEPTRLAEKRAEAERAREERARLRAEQAERRARRLETWGSASDSDDVCPPSPTWEDEFMHMVQADAYMDSFD